MKRKTTLAPIAAAIVFSFSVSTVYGFEPLVTPSVDDMVLYDDEENTQAEIDLGKTLFFDNRLSSNHKQNCATCHDPEKGFSDGMATGFGTEGNKLERNSPQLYNLGWSSIFMWDGREPTLESQALGPIQAAGEMNLPIPELLTRLNAVEGYRKLFKDVYEIDEITADAVGRAIAAFERSIIVDNTPFDQFLAGDKSAMSESAQRGLAVFSGKGNCAQCHDGANFTDDSFHNLGFGGDNHDKGRAAITGDVSQTGAFKTPGLRNIEFSAPYMHDGSIATLESVVDYYNRGGSGGEHTSDIIKPLQLTQVEQQDLVAFLKSLSQDITITVPKIPN